MNINVLLPLSALSLLAAGSAQDPGSVPVAEAAGFERDRFVWFGSDQDNPIVAQVSVGAPRTTCPNKGEQPWAGLKSGRRVMFGDTWACFDTFTDLRIATGRLPAGSYLLALARAKSGFELLWFDAAKTMSRRGKGLADLRPVFRAPLAEASPGSFADRLHFDLASIARVEEAKAVELHRVQLDITFGKLAFTLPIDVIGASEQRVTLDDPRRISCWQIDDRDNVIIEYGSPPWSKTIATAADKLQGDFRWRLGQNWWTCLRTTRRLRIGSKQIKPGNYHLSLLVHSPATVELLISDAGKDVIDKVDAAFSKSSKTLLRVPLTSEAAADSSNERPLQIGLAQNDGHARLTICFGPHAYYVPVTRR